MGKGTHVLASWIDISNNNSPTVAISSGFHSPFGCATPVMRFFYYFSYGLLIMGLWKGIARLWHLKPNLLNIYCWFYEYGNMMQF